MGLTVAFAIVLLTPATRSYFGLTAPDPPVIYVAVPALLVWFAVISVALRFRVLERMLGLLGGAAEPSTAPVRRR